MYGKKLGKEIFFLKNLIF